MWDTRRDLAACFTDLALRLAEARQRVVHVEPSQRLCRDQVKDGHVDTMGCVRSCYPYFVVFYILCLRSILVF
jgi:hypothetical protein